MVLDMVHRSHKGVFMETAPIANTGFMLTLPDGYARESTARDSACVLARRSPSGKVALFAYSYESDQPLAEQLDTLAEQLRDAFSMPNGSSDGLEDGTAEGARGAFASTSIGSAEAIGNAADHRGSEEVGGNAEAVFTLGVAESEGSEKQPEQLPATISAEMTQRCNQPCGYLEYPACRQPAQPQDPYPDFPSCSVRTFLFQNGTACLRLDMVHTPDSRRTTDGLVGNLTYIGG